jgi:hypothetical protein
VKPYKDLEVEESVVIRIFNQEIDPIELMWHRDNEDRIIESIGVTDWKVQLDNTLPVLIKGQIFIPRGVWHRAIKGTGSLTIKIIKK